MRTDIYKYKPGSVTHAYLFDSIEDLLGEIAKVPESRVKGANIDIGSRSFVGRRFKSWGEVYDAARQAWPEGLSIVDRMLRDLDGIDLPRPTSRRRRIRFNEDNGDEVDYDRLRSGQSYWRTTRRQNSRGPATITVLVDVGANCMVRHSDILWRGAAAIALTKRLEEAGYRVELWAVHQSTDLWRTDITQRQVDGFHAACLKRPGDPLDPSTLIAAVSGWFFRTVWFRAACLGNLEVHRNLGHHRVPREVDLDRITPDSHRILIAGAFSYEGAVSLIRNVLTQLSTN